MKHFHSLAMLATFLLVTGFSLAEDIVIYQNDSSHSQRPYIDGDHIVNATRGKLISMKCVVHNLKSYKIAFYFNGILLALNNMRIKDDKRYSIENPHQNEWRLVVDPVDSDNEGQYSCRLSNGMKKTIFLRVGVPPIFSGNNETHQILINTFERQNVTLICEANGNPKPTIHWYKHGKLITTGSHLDIRNVTKHSHLEYECVARNGIEPDPSRHFKLNVNFKPTLNMMYHLKDQKAINKNQETGLKNIGGTTMSGANNDGELQIVCEITGNPINSINWFKDGFRVKDESSHINEKYITYRSNNSKVNSRAVEQHKKKKKMISIHTTQLSPHKFISKLKIKNLENYDNGIYKCSVNGLEGEVTKTITISDAHVKALQASHFTDETDQMLNVNQLKQHSPSGHVHKNSKHLITGDSNSRQDVSAENFHKNSQLKLDDNVDSKIESSSYLASRGARSNLTRSNDSIFEENNATNFELNVFISVFLVMTATLLNSVNFV